MSRTYSVAEARSNLATIVDQAESGLPVELTRRGEPVAVVVSRRDFDRLGAPRRQFGDAYRNFLRRFPLADLELEARVVVTRDKAPGRKVSL